MILGSGERTRSCCKSSWSTNIQGVPRKSYCCVFVVRKTLYSLSCTLLILFWIQTCIWRSSALTRPRPRAMVPSTIAKVTFITDIVPRIKSSRQYTRVCEFEMHCLLFVSPIKFLKCVRVKHSYYIR